MNKTILSLITFTLFFIGCTGKVMVAEYYPVDKTDKSITISAGGDYFFTLFKKTLLNDGWDLQVDANSLLTQGSNASQETTIKSKTKYRLYMKWRTMPDLFGGDKVHAYQVSVVDNRTGKEVMSMSKSYSPANKVSAEDTIEEIMPWFRGLK